MAKPGRTNAGPSSKRRSKPSLKIVITAGPTREYLDSVRFLSNPSSGKMGYAIAAAAARRGHDVVLVSGPVSLSPPPSVRVVSVETGKEMAAAAKQAFQDADAAIFAAAVCDYRPARRRSRKLPKRNSGLSIDLVPTEDIAATLGRSKGNRVTLAFALEDHDGRAKAERKRIAKHADAMLLNAPSNIDSNRAKFEFLDPGGAWHDWPEGTKARIAIRVVRSTEALCASRGWR